MDLVCIIHTLGIKTYRVRIAAMWDPMLGISAGRNNVSEKPIPFISSAKGTLVHLYTCTASSP
jgi:hypothetical protein